MASSNSPPTNSIHFLGSPGSCKSALIDLFEPEGFNKVHWLSDVHGASLKETNLNMRLLAKQVSSRLEKPFLERFTKPQLKWVNDHLPEGFDASLPTVVIFDICGQGNVFVTPDGTPTKNYKEVLADPNALFVVQDPQLVSGTLGVLAKRKSHYNLAVTDEESLVQAVKVWAFMNSTGKREYSKAVAAFGDRVVYLPGYKAPQADMIERALSQFKGFLRPGQEPPQEALDALVKMAPFVPEHRLPLEECVAHLVAKIRDPVAIAHPAYSPAQIVGKVAEMVEQVMVDVKEFPTFYAYQFGKAGDLASSYSLPVIDPERFLHLTALFLGKKAPAEDKVELAAQLDEAKGQPFYATVSGIVHAETKDKKMSAFIVEQPSGPCQPTTADWAPHLTLQAVGVPPSVAGPLVAAALAGTEPPKGLTITKVERFEPVKIPGLLTMTC